MNKLEALVKNLNDTSADTLISSIKDSLPIGGMGPYPLTGPTELSGTGVDTITSGKINFGLQDITVDGLKITNVTSGLQDNNRATINVEFQTLKLDGKYDVYVIQAPIVDMDTGGNMSFLAFSALATPNGPTTPSGPDAPTITVEQYDQLNQANDQKNELNKTAAGRQLLGTYNQHNDVYNYCFQTNSGLRDFWKKDGTSQDMCNYTSNALKADLVVNPAQNDRTFGKNGASYNENAFLQAFALHTACMVAKGNYHDPNKALDAAKAIPSFMNTVSQTGNTKDKTSPMTSSQVYSTLQQNSPSPPHAVSSLRSVSSHPITEALTAIALNNHNNEHISLLENLGYNMDDNTIQAMQEIYHAGIHDGDPQNQAQLWQGNFNCIVPSFQMKIMLTLQDDGVITGTLNYTNLAIPQLGIDTSKWGGTAGQVSAKRMNNSAFVIGLLHDRVAQVLEDQIVNFLTAQGG